MKIVSLALASASMFLASIPTLEADQPSRTARERLLETLFEEEPESQSPIDETSKRELYERVARVFVPVEGKERALDVAQTHRLQPGERVVVRGRVIGTERLFEEGEALMIIADPAYVVPDERHAHPYRSGSVPANVKRAHMLSVQILDDEGKILPVSLKGIRGLKEMDYIVVSGVMGADTTASSPVVDADAIEIVEQWQMVAPSAENLPVEEPCISCATGSCPPASDAETHAKQNKASGENTHAESR